MADPWSQGSTSRDHLLPNRRRHSGIGSGHPLHGEQSVYSSPLRYADDTERPSAFLHPSSRKRSYQTASITPSPSAPSTFNTQRSYPRASPARREEHLISSFCPYEPSSASSASELPDLGSDSSLLYARVRPPSPASKFHALTRQRHGAHTPAVSQAPNSMRPPQSDFNFQIACPPNDTHEHDLGREGHYGSESSSEAFARLAKAQREQQEARRQAASGATSAIAADEPPTKKRRGVAGAIVEGALHAALYTGAAALTAYSLWSSWGRTGNEDDDDDLCRVHEKLPPGALDEPPPPYAEQQSKPFESFSKAPSSTPVQQRPVHVFVSSRRRRPVFASSRKGTPKGKGHPSTVSSPAAMSPTPAPKSLPHTLSLNDMHGSMEGQNSLNDADEDDDDDEVFARFQSRMSNLIEEGTKALNSQADISNMDISSDEEGFQHTSFSRQSAPQSPSSPQRSIRVPALSSPLHGNSASNSSLNDAGDATDPALLPNRSHRQQVLGHHATSSPYSRLPRPTHVLRRPN